MKLLRTLDALVRRDANPAGLQGTVAIGVRGPEEFLFWTARFDAGVATRFGKEVPRDSDVILFLGAQDADAILTTGQLPRKPQLLFVEGDRSLMTRFISRYTTRMSVLGARSAQIVAAR